MFAHEQILLLSGDAFSLCAVKFSLNSESALARVQLAIKGNDNNIIKKCILSSFTYPTYSEAIQKLCAKKCKNRHSRYIHILFYDISNAFLWILLSYYLSWTADRWLNWIMEVAVDIKRHHAEQENSVYQSRNHQSTFRASLCSFKLFSERVVKSLVVMRLLCSYVLFVKIIILSVHVRIIKLCCSQSLFSAIIQKPKTWKHPTGF